MSQNDDKQRLRAEVRGRREAVSPVERDARSQAACARATALPEFERAAIVAGFVAVKSELDPGPAIEAAWAGGKTVVLPRVTKRSPRLRFHRVDQGAVLEDAAFGLREPHPDWPEVAPEQVDLYLMPGLAFDEHGGRLGWGGGYYDEIANGLRSRGVRSFLVGIGYDFQVVERVPTAAGDAAIDCVVTDRRTIVCAKAAS